MTSVFCHALGASDVVVGAVRSMWIADTVASETFPARSATLCEADKLSPSPVTVESPGQAPLMPERSSWHVHCTRTSSRYQPAAFGAVVGAPVSAGAVSSTLIPVTAASSVFPAASTAVPVTDCAAPSPSVTGPVQDATPERASSPDKWAVTCARYDPVSS